MFNESDEHLIRLAKVRVYKLLLLATLLAGVQASAQYTLKIVPVDRDTVFIRDTLALQQSFANRLACDEYISKLGSYLLSKGYPTASLDSIYVDSAGAYLQLYIGQSYTLSGIIPSGVSMQELEQAGWRSKGLLNKPLDPLRLQQLKENLVAWYEENGYPFASVRFDSLRFDSGRLKAIVQVNKGPHYKIDSIHVSGTARINSVYLQRYLDIRDGSYYQKSKFQNINKRLLELPFLVQQQPWDLSMLATGSTLNLYLQPKKSSQINVLVGFLPANQAANNSYEQVRTKLLFTGEATINLKNALGNGESIGLDWQQLQQKSPKLNLQYQQPYLFGSAFGVATSFDLFKKDSSYLNLNFQLGMLYSLSVNQTGRVFIQSLATNLLNVDTVAIRRTRKLPTAIDMNSFNLGVDYNLNKTNYRRNPRSGFEWQLTATAGTKNIKKNSVISKLADPDFQYAALYDTLKLKSYQFSLRSAFAYYFPLGRQSALKAGFNGGWLQSPSIFRNELFQIGGYRILRGFDEESIFTSAYTVTTAEYRYLVGMNSYFFVFGDWGLAQNKSISVQSSNSYISAGLGMAFETKAGVFNISYANGKRNDLKFDLRQSKIHIGYLNYF